MRNTAGATAVEYAIIASVVSVAALGAFISVGEQSEENMNSVADKYAEAQTK
ncbi:Flp family type IVb pilin [Altererythrobacter sp. MF3-039]|uniref:Flp family type IVb pilin n=1 Tax=Altererythrobacter sp. MF3-039 TaxID=3252901 RepID=UPI00390CAC3F